jgi:ornithine cyclodeaminase/alanine dehydrogenase-like protein (mu-crystallin family)
MELGKEILFLSNADIEATGVTSGEINRAVETMFAAKAAGRTAIKPKISINLADGQQFQAKAGVMEAPAYAAVKWVAPTPANEARGLMSYRPLILLNDSVTGLPLAFMDGMWVTGTRTAAISAVAAKYLARRDSRSIGFLACGLQARTHLDAMRAEFGIERVVAYSRRRETAQAFVERARAMGLAAEVVEEPRAVVEAVDILVSSIPHGRGVPPFLDAGWMRAGCFAALTDLGHCFHPETLAVIDKMATDDLEQSGPAGPEAMNYAFPYYAEIGELVAGAKPGREAEDERNGVIFSGIGLGDAAAGGLVYERAVENGLGRVLTL